MNKRFLYLLLVLPLIVCSCGDDNDEPGLIINSENKNANIAGVDQSVLGLEIPHLNSRYDYICHRLGDGDVNYTIEYDRQNFHSHWVAYTFNTKNARAATSRTNAWSPEPYYNTKKQYQITTSSFPGYQRGHLVGSAERLCTVEANEQTFYMSNMSPMLSAFNTWYWGATESYDGVDGIESLVRDKWGKQVVKSNSAFYGGTLYVVKGGTLDQQLGKCRVRNTQGEEVQMAVPKYYWIACLFVAESGAARAIGFWMEHKDYRDQSPEFLRKLRRECACSIDELEQRTGIDFFCNLKDAVEDPVERTCTLSQWPGL